MSNINICFSGWRYYALRGDFYSKGLKQRLSWPYASRAVKTPFEINGFLLCTGDTRAVCALVFVQRHLMISRVSVKAAAVYHPH